MPRNYIINKTFSCPLTKTYDKGDGLVSAFDFDRHTSKDMVCI